MPGLNQTARRGCFDVAELVSATFTERYIASEELYAAERWAQLFSAARLPRPPRNRLVLRSLRSLDPGMPHAFNKWHLIAAARWFPNLLAAANAHPSPIRSSTSMFTEVIR